MGILLARQGRLLREYAWHCLGEGATVDEVESTVERTIDLLLQPGAVVHQHALRHATQQLWHECQRTLQERRSPSQVLVDRRVGPLNEQARRILERLGPRSREAILRAAQGWTPEQQAEADHTSVGTINIRLHRARRRFLQLKAEMGSSASAVGGFLLTMAHPLSGRVARRASAAGAHGGVAPFLAGVALAPLVAMTFWSGGATLVHPTVSHRPGGAAPESLIGPPHRFTSVAQAGTSQAATRVAAATTQMPTTAPTTHPPAVNGLVRLLDKIADLQLTAVATLPGVQGRVIVGIGEGPSFGSPLLVQSLDGGATWSATSGPPAIVTQLALPPDYPADPRIFGGVDALGGSAPYEAAAFGQPFKPLTGLPAGHVAVSAHFDDGDPRLFSASSTGVWSVNVGVTPLAPPHEEVDYTAAFALQSVVATLATPPAIPRGPALLAWSPAGSTVPGTPWEPAVNAPVIACPVNGLCATKSFLPTSPGGISVAGSSVVAYNANEAFLSFDEASSFRQLPLPAASKVIFSLTFVGAADELWLSTTTANSRAVVYRNTESGWQDESSGDTVVTARAGELVAAAPNDVIDVLPDAGYRCTSAAAIDWLPRCP